MMATDVIHDFTQIHDEDTLKQMWHETEDYSRKKDIRTHMYKLREERSHNKNDSYSNSRRVNQSESSTSSTVHYGSQSESRIQSSKQLESDASSSSSKIMHCDSSGGQWESGGAASSAKQIQSNDQRKANNAVYDKINPNGITQKTADAWNVTAAETQHSDGISHSSVHHETRAGREDFSNGYVQYSGEKSANLIAHDNNDSFSANTLDTCHVEGVVMDAKTDKHGHTKDLYSSTTSKQYEHIAVSDNNSIASSSAEKRANQSLLADQVRDTEESTVNRRTVEELEKTRTADSDQKNVVTRVVGPCNVNGSRRISVDVSPSHNAFARSLRSTSPDRVHHISTCRLSKNNISSETITTYITTSNNNESSSNSTIAKDIEYIKNLVVADHLGDHTLSSANGKRDSHAKLAASQKRTTADTYDERCRQILGISTEKTSLTSAKRSSSERLSRQRDSADRWNQNRNDLLNQSNASKTTKMDSKKRDKSVMETTDCIVRSDDSKREMKEFHKVEHKDESEIVQLCEFPAQVRREEHLIEGSPEKRNQESPQPPQLTEYLAEKRLSSQKESIYTDKKKMVTDVQEISEFPAQVRRPSPHIEPLAPCPAKKKFANEPHVISEYPAQIRRDSSQREPLEPYPQKKKVICEPPQISEFPSQIRRTSQERALIEHYPEKVKEQSEPSKISEFPAQIRRASPQMEPLETFPEKTKSICETQQILEFPSQIRRGSPERAPLEPYPEKKKQTNEPSKISEYPAQIRRDSPQREPLESYPEKKKLIYEPPQVSEFPSQIRRTSPERTPIEHNPEKVKERSEPSKISEFPAQIRRASPQMEPLETFPEKKKSICETHQISEFPSQIRRGSPETGAPLEPHPEKVKQTNVPSKISEYPAQMRRASPVRAPLECNPEKVKERSEPSKISEFPAQIRRASSQIASPLETLPEKKKSFCETHQVSEFPSQIRRGSPERALLEPHPEKVKQTNEPSNISEYPAQIRRASPARAPLEHYPEKVKERSEPSKISEFPAQIRRDSFEKAPLEPYPENTQETNEPSKISEFPTQIRCASSEMSTLEQYPEKIKKINELTKVSEFPVQIRRTSPQREPLESHLEKKKSISKSSEISEFPAQIRRSSPEKQAIELYPEKVVEKSEPSYIRKNSSPQKKTLEQSSDISKKKGNSLKPREFSIESKREINTPKQLNVKDGKDLQVCEFSAQTTSIGFNRQVLASKPQNVQEVNNCTKIDLKMITESNRKSLEPIPVQEPPFVRKHSGLLYTETDSKFTKNSLLETTSPAQNSTVKKQLSKSPQKINKKQENISPATKQMRTSTKLIDTMNHVSSNTSSMNVPKNVESNKQRHCVSTSVPITPKNTNELSKIIVVPHQQNDDKLFVSNRKHLEEECSSVATVTVNLQRSKSSRNSSPDRCCPFPVTRNDDDDDDDDESRSKHNNDGYPQRYPDLITEPDDNSTHNSTNNLLATAILEDSIDANQSVIELAIDTVDNRNTSGSDLLRSTSMVTNVSEGDDCLLTVSEKVNKFTATVEQLNSPNKGHQEIREHQQASEDDVNNPLTTMRTTSTPPKSQHPIGHESIRKTKTIFEPTPRKGSHSHQISPDIRRRLTYPDEGVSEDGDNSTPHYMKPLDRSLRPNSPHRDSVCVENLTDAKSSISTKFGVTLRRTKSAREPPSTSVIIDRNIEDIFDLERLEHMLETATTYDLRHRIRNQIRHAKEEQVAININKVLDSATTPTTTKLNGCIDSKVKKSTSDSRRHCSKTDWIKQKISTNEKSSPVVGKSIGSSSEKKMRKHSTDSTCKVEISKATTTITHESEGKPKNAPTKNGCAGKVCANGTKSSIPSVDSINMVNEEKLKTAKHSFVRTLSKRFLNSSGDKSKKKENVEPSYPKAGLILRTASSFTQKSRQLNSKNGSVLHQQQQQQQHQSLNKTDPKQNHQRSATVKALVPPIDGKTKNAGNQQVGGGTFLTNPTKVTGIQDIICRMTTTGEVDGGGDCNAGEEHAKDLLNKLLGSQLILSGVEANLMASAKTVRTLTTTAETSASTTISASSSDPNQVRSTSGSSSVLVAQTGGIHTTTKLTITKMENGKPITKTYSFQHPISDEALNSISDEEVLRQLVEQVEDYEERRRIRTHLRHIMADKQQQENTNSASIKVPSGESEEQASDPTVTTKQEVAKSSTTTIQYSMSNKSVSPFEKFRQMDKQNSINTPPRTCN